MIYNWIPKNLLFKLWSFWPPFLGAGIRVSSVSSDYRDVVVTLKRHFWNRNFVGTQYGGSLFSMTDACYMVMLLLNLGSDYIIWDKSASIRYLKPGKTDVTARFTLTEEALNSIRLKLEKEEKMDWTTNIQIMDRNNEAIAVVEKVIYIRRKKKS